MNCRYIPRCHVLFPNAKIVHSNVRRRRTPGIRLAPSVRSKSFKPFQQPNLTKRQLTPWLVLPTLQIQTEEGFNQYRLNCSQTQNLHTIVQWIYVHFLCWTLCLSLCASQRQSQGQNGQLVSASHAFKDLEEELRHSYPKSKRIVIRERETLVREDLVVSRNISSNSCIIIHSSNISFKL